MLVGEDLRAYEQVHPLRVARQVHRGLAGGVAAAEHEDLLAGGRRGLRTADAP